MKKILFIDNFDSFTYNLVQRLGEIDATLDVRVFVESHRSELICDAYVAAAYSARDELTPMLRWTIMILDSSIDCTAIGRLNCR